jgi:hypothetical protein
MASRYKPDQIPLKGDTEPRGRLAIKGGILTRNSATAVYFDDGELDAPEYHFKSRLNPFSGAFASALILPVYGVPARTEVSYSKSKTESTECPRRGTARLASISSARSST